jgi:galactonate dehydratase
VKVTTLAYVHEIAAPYLLGQDPLRIDRHARQLYGYLGFNSTGAEARGNSAIDLALWDLFGKATGQPVYQLLGGASRDRIRIYNALRRLPVRPRSERPGGRQLGSGDRASSRSVRGSRCVPESRRRAGQEPARRGYHRHEDLALRPVRRGIRGHYISGADLHSALEPFRKIRRAVGDAMDIMVEFHSLWDPTTAKRITHALEDFNPYWYEDPIQMDNLPALGELAQSTRAPITASETLGTRWSFRQLLEQRAAGIVMLDVSWCGGLSEARKIAAIAEAHQLPVAPHDCTGPVVLMASVHLSMNATNALIQETVRAFLGGWYSELVTRLPRIERGYVYPPEGPGLGTELLPGLERRPDAIVRVSAV